MDEITKQAIDSYQKEGFSFFPIPYKSKQAAIEWKEYQTRKPSDIEIAKWKSNGVSNIAIVCGAVSGNLAVLDFDDHQKWLDYVTHVQDKFNIDLFTFTRLIRTCKGIHVYLRLSEPIKNQKFPKLDIKAEGGYVIAPPSIHPSGTKYECINPKIPVRTINSLNEIGIDINQKVEAESIPDTMGEIVPIGCQNDWLYKQACRYRRQNDNLETIFEKLRIDLKRCPQDPSRPPFTNTDLLEIAKSACKHPPDPHGNNGILSYNTAKEGGENSNRDETVTKTVTKEQVLGWIRDTTGWWKVDELDKDLNIKTEAEKANRRQILKRLKNDDKLIEKHPKENSLWRFVNVAVRLIDFKSAGNRAPLLIKYPFGIENYFNTYPGNIIVIAGVTDTGKTAFLFNFVKQNMYEYPIFYQSSEMGDTEIAASLQKFKDIDLQDWNFISEERSSDFADVIRPDAINIVDYLELTENFYLAAQQEKAIHEKLKSGIALIAMQKNDNAPYAFGGILTASLPRLYLTIDKCPDGQLMKMKKAKNWANPEINPNRLAINYKIVNGSQLIITSPWHEVTE